MIDNIRTQSILTILSHTHAPTQEDLQLIKRFGVRHGFSFQNETQGDHQSSNKLRIKAYTIIMFPPPVSASQKAQTKREGKVEEERESAPSKHEDIYETYTKKNEEGTVWLTIRTEQSQRSIHNRQRLPPFSVSRIFRR